MNIITHQLKVWQGDFGREYTDRNFSASYNERNISNISSLFRLLLSYTDSVKSILEVGCNIGCNLLIFSQLGNFELVGIEPQDYAIKKGREINKKATFVRGSVFNLPFTDSYFDLVFTRGVVTHIAPEDLKNAIDEMIRVSSRYLFFDEYYHANEVEVLYRGQAQLLWKRDLAKSYFTQYANIKLLYEEEYEDGKNVGLMNKRWLFEKM